MLIPLQRYLRNQYHRLRQGNNPHYQVFAAMYTYDPKPFPWIQLLDENVFVSSYFLSPALNRYSGLEFAALNAHHLCSYWLPGVQSKAQGTIPPIGEYFVSFRIFDKGAEQYSHIQKTTASCAKFRSISKTPEHSRGYTHLACNLLSYDLFKEELWALINHWIIYKNIFS